MFRSRRPIHVLHVRKTGGTAVKFALRGHLKCKRHRLVLHEHDFRLTDVPVGEGVVVFLRDPISRFISGFNSRLRQGRPRYHRPWTDGERAAFAVFADPCVLAEALSAASDVERNRAEEAMRSIRHVSDHYAYWFESEDYVRHRAADLFHIGFQETLEDDFAELRHKLALPPTITLPNDDVDAHRSPVPAPRLSQRAIRNLRSWYALDYAFAAMFGEFKSRDDALPQRPPN